VGGRRGSDFLSTVEIFNVDSKIWRPAGRIINKVNFIITKKIGIDSKTCCNKVTKLLHKTSLLTTRVETQVQLRVFCNLNTGQSQEDGRSLDQKDEDSYLKSIFEK
jgi:hypothetical protein